MRNPLRYFNGSPEMIRFAVMMHIRYPLLLRQIGLTMLTAMITTF